MDPQNYETLRLLIMTRAMLSDPPSPHQIAHERRQAQRLSAYIPRRLRELNATPHDLAKAIDIEIEFVDTLLDGTFPLSTLSSDMWRDLAAGLQCSVANLLHVINATASLRWGSV